MPDNQTLIPVCVSCWLELSVTERCSVVASFRQAEAMENLANCMLENMTDAVQQAVSSMRHRRSGMN